MDKLIEKFNGLSFFMKIAVIAAILFVGSAVVAGIYDSIVGPEETAKEPIEETKEDEPAENEEEPNEDEPEEVEEPEETITVNLNEELLFGEFSVNFEALAIEEGIATLSYTWLNQAGDGNKYFYALAGIGASQNDETLEEVSGAYDVLENPNHGMQIHNREGGRIKITLEYELMDEESPINVTISPYNDYGEDSQTVTIEIK